MSFFNCFDNLKTSCATALTPCLENCILWPMSVQCRPNGGRYQISIGTKKVVLYHYLPKWCATSKPVLAQKKFSIQFCQNGVALKKKYWPRKDCLWCSYKTSVGTIEVFYHFAKMVCRQQTSRQMTESKTFIIRRKFNQHFNS